VVAVKFQITFHTPFRVASGRAGDGSDTTVDRGALLPASSIKGLMRSSARDVLNFPRELIAGTFGTTWEPSPWSWSDARITGSGGQADIRARARIRIDAQTGTVAPGALLIADEVHAASAEFSIDRSGWIEAGDIAVHETVLLAAARAVTAAGGDRRRGLGWITVTPVQPEWSPGHLLAATELIRAAAGARALQAAGGTDRPDAGGPAGA
jgi:CRISPR/Cas system CSM-associated protein Csm3 (group 7 of RAMP superfamily)